MYLEDDTVMHSPGIHIVCHGLKAWLLNSPSKTLQLAACSSGYHIVAIWLAPYISRWEERLIWLRKSSVVFFVFLFFVASKESAQSWERPGSFDTAIIGSWNLFRVKVISRTSVSHKSFGRGCQVLRGTTAQDGACLLPCALSCAWRVTHAPRACQN